MKVGCANNDERISWKKLETTELTKKLDKTGISNSSWPQTI